MKYMLLIYNEEKAWGKFSEAQRQGFMGEFMKFTQQIQSAGQWLASSQLQPTSAATSVRLRDGKRLVTDGPDSGWPVLSCNRRRQPPASACAMANAS